MSYLALYRKYRPNNFDDLVGQNEVASIIKNEIINNKLSHAYLFSGPRGTGKTSTAKILAKMINCSSLNSDGIPCGKCESCLNFYNTSDIVEIDAASNNGVDEIRELRDKVNLVPTYGRYKVYIIDEVHMLTTQAFNALLKTLEEPPSHVIFILATTEFYKIPITVISRCQKFQFYKFSIDDIVNRLSYICKNEKIVADDGVLVEIARLSDGGMRDAINMLDQLSSFSDSSISINDVYLLNGVSSYNDFLNLSKYVFDNNIVEITNFIENVDRSGKSFDRFMNDYMIFLKDVLLYFNDSSIISGIVDKDEAVKSVSSMSNSDVIFEFINILNDLSIRIKNSLFSKILLIVGLINFSNKLFVNNKKELCDIKENNSSQIVNFTEKVLVENSLKPFLTDKIKMIRINNAFATASKNLKDNFISKWNVVQNIISSDNNYESISLMLRDVEIMVVGKNNVIFLVPYDSLVERLINYNDLIEKLLFEVYNIKYKFVFLVKDEWLFEKDKYISNLKSGTKYEYIIEDDNSDVSNNSDNDINELVSILGNDVISYE